MTSSLVRGKEVSRFSPRLKTAEEATFAICKIWSALAISFVVLTGSLRAEFVYVTNAKSNNISAYHIEEKGGLTPVAGSPFPAGDSPGSLAVDSWSRSVYVATGSNSVSAYHFSKNGVLTPVAGSPFPVGNNPGFVFVDLLGRLVYVTSDNKFSAYQIRENGALTPAAESPFPPGRSAVDLLRRFVYVANGGSNTVSG